jgi:hypothetical protein
MRHRCLDEATQRHRLRRAQRIDPIDMRRIARAIPAKTHEAGNEADGRLRLQKGVLELQPTRGHHIIRIHASDEVSSAGLAAMLKGRRDACGRLL